MNDEVSELFGKRFVYDHHDLAPEQVSYRVEDTEYFNLLVRPPHGKYSERPI